MIWHFAEVWMMIVLMFVIGCLAGAHLYGMVAGSRLAFVQGAAADAFGDTLDFIKTKTGLGPAWRRGHLRNIDRPLTVQRAPVDTQTLDAVLSDTPAEISTTPDQSAPREAERPEKGPRKLLQRVLISRPRFRRVAQPARTTAIEPPRAPKPVALPPPVLPMRPAGIVAPRGGVPDNLQRIKGIGKRNEEMLNQLGIFHFGQIAAWTPGEVLWIGQYLAFPERIARDEWVKQATLLAMGGETGFQKSADRRRERRKQEREFQERMTTASNAFDAEPETDYPADDDIDEYDGDDDFLAADDEIESPDSETDAIDDDQDRDEPR